MKIEIRPLTSSEDENTLNRVACLFLELYKYMNSLGLIHKLIENGEFLWINTIKKTLGKLNIVVVATYNDSIVGFAAGNIRLLPNYLGSKKVDYISHVFISDGFKNQNIGQKLVEELENCFAEKSVEAIELEVLFENTAGARFWEKLGYISDNIRMIKIK